MLLLRLLIMLTVVVGAMVPGAAGRALRRLGRAVQRAGGRGLGRDDVEVLELVEEHALKPDAARQADAGQAGLAVRIVRVGALLLVVPEVFALHFDSAVAARNVLASNAQGGIF